MTELRKPESSPRELKPLRVILLEGQPAQALRIQQLLQREGDHQFQVQVFEKIQPSSLRLVLQETDLVLLDLAIEGSEDLSPFKKVEELAGHVPIIVLSNQDDDALAMQAVHEGAQDYLVKGKLDRALLTRSIRYAVERKQAEVALLQAEEKYRGIFEHIVEGIFQTSPEGRYLSANPALARIYGYENAEELINSITDIGRRLYVDSHRRDQFVRIMQEYDVVTNFESAVFRKDGTQIWISENVRAVRDAFGKLLFYEGTVEDITERKRTEELLKNSEALYHSLVENLPQNILRKDLNERFTFANQRFCKVLGKSLDEILGRTDFDFFPPALAAKYQRDDRQVLETGKMFETVEEHQPPGGRKMYVNVMKTPVFDANGQTIGLQGIFWDITERKEAEERERLATAELARSREELRQKNQQLEDDLKMAAEIQQAILPQQYPCFPHDASPQSSRLQFCHRYHPSGTVGGDFFNVMALSDSKAGLFICDVMGHGVRSALITAMVRALVEELKPLAEDPGALFTRLNRELSCILKPTGVPTFTTALYAIVDLDKGEIRYANAGHPKPLLLRRELNQVEMLQPSHGKPQAALGLFDGSAYETYQTHWSVGDMLMLFTDGLYEVEGPQEAFYSQEMLVAAVKNSLQLPGPALFDKLLNEVTHFSTEKNFADDVCLLGVENRRP